MPAKDSAIQTWQCVIVVWGSKYSGKDIRRLVESIRKHSSGEPRFVLLTDRERPNFPEGLLVVPIPEFFLNSVFKGTGCQTKLAIFEKGIVPEDLPAIYVDLDTMVLGDLGELISMHDNPRTVAIMQSAVVPIGWPGRVIYKLSGGRKYARGNSSLVVFHPAKCHYIARQFRELHAKHAGFGIKPMIADERFVSWVAQDDLCAVSNRFAVKFPTEFMLPWLWMARLRASLPWVRYRRENLKVISFPGRLTKPEHLVTLHDGTVVSDHKNRKVIWSDSQLGSVKQKIIDYYSSD